MDEESLSESMGGGMDSDVVDEGIDSDVDGGIPDGDSDMEDGVVGSDSGGIPSDSDGVQEKYSSIASGVDESVSEVPSTTTTTKPPAPKPAPAAAATKPRPSPKRTPSKHSLKPQGSVGSMRSEPSVDVQSLYDTISRLELQVSQLQEDLSKAQVTETQAKELAERLERAEKAKDERPPVPEDMEELYDRLDEKDQELHQKSEALVEQAQKNYGLAQVIRELREETQTKKAEMDSVRASLITGIAGPDSQPALYQNVTTAELLRIRTKHIDTGEKKASFATTMARTKMEQTRGGSRSSSRSGSRAGSRAGTPPSESKAGLDETSGSAAGGISAVMEAEREIKSLKDRCRRLYDKNQAMEEDLQHANEQIAQMETMRNQVHNYAERFRFEKDARARTEEDALASQEKIDALSDHIEKLMNHLKHEAAAKAKAYETGRRAEKELQLLRNRNAALAKRNASRERVIVELKEGARILEDQLRLMDEKYIDLRGKLDWTRAHSQKEVKKISTQAEKLRMKWMMAQSMGAIPKHLMDNPKELKETMGH